MSLAQLQPQLVIKYSSNSILFETEIDEPLLVTRHEINEKMEKYINASHDRNDIFNK